MVLRETRVPFVDLRPVSLPLLDELIAGFEGVLESGSFIHGPEVAAFEEAFARFCHCGYCIGVSSGLDALRIGLIASGITPGDEVIVPANTFVATFEAIVQAGGSPVVVDVSEADYNIDPRLVEQAIGPRTRILLPVHLYGQMADIRSLAAIAEAHELRIVEDACQAHGAERDGVRAGSAGTAAAFSFYPAKNLGAIGDAGALVTSDNELATVARALREHGEVEKYRSAFIGYTARLDAIQALVLNRKLPLLNEWNTQRAEVADFYDAALAGIGDLRLPPRAPGSRPVWHLYVVRTAQREALAAFLAERGIATGRHYPEPPHLSRAFGRLGYGPGSFPVTEGLANELLSLPMYPGITITQREIVADTVRAYFNGG